MLIYIFTVYVYMNLYLYMYIYTYTELSGLNVNVFLLVLKAYTKLSNCFLYYQTVRIHCKIIFIEWYSWPASWKQIKSSFHNKGKETAPVIISIPSVWSNVHTGANLLSRHLHVAALKDLKASVCPAATCLQRTSCSTI